MGMSVYDVRKEVTSDSDDNEGNAENGSPGFSFQAGDYDQDYP